jgi:signal transduction histidine kinase
MAERAHALGGRVAWGPLAGGGFAVRARLPLAGDRA